MTSKISMMNRYLLICALICASTVSFAQDTVFYRGKVVVPLDSSVIKATDALYNRVRSNLESQGALILRRKGAHFLEQMKVIAEPSTLSGYGTHYKWQLQTAIDTNFQKRQHILNWDTRIPIAIGGKRWANNLFVASIHIEPRLKVRILNNDASLGDSSEPVRTPSLMGGINIFLAPIGWSVKEKWQERVGKNRLKTTYFGLSMYHHSNGQDGEHFDSSGVVQAYNGDFSEQLIVDVGMGSVHEYFGKWNLHKNSTSAKRSGKTPKVRAAPNQTPTNYDRLFYWKLGFEWHSKKLGPIYNSGESWQKYKMYGRKRINLQMGWAITPEYADIMFDEKTPGKYHQLTPYQSKELCRFVWNLKFIADRELNVGNINALQPATISERINTNISMYWRIPGTQGVALFLQVGYYGSDNYNIYFQRRYIEIRSGLAYGFLKYPKAGDFGVD